MVGTSRRIFDWKQQVNATAQELQAGSTEFNGTKYQADFQRAGWRALQEFKAAKPRLAGADTRLFAAVVRVITGFQQAAFYREATGAENAPGLLLHAARELIATSPEPLDMEPLRHANQHVRSQFLSAERCKSERLLTIPGFEVRLPVVNPWSRAINAYGTEAIEKGADLDKLLEYINTMHYHAVEMFLLRFAADLPKVADEVQAAKAMAAALHRQASERQA